MTGSRLRYAGRRLAQAVPVVLAMVIFNFALLHLAPGDAADVLAGESGEFIALRHREFVLACEALGMGERAIIFRQILPKAAGLMNPRLRQR